MQGKITAQGKLVMFGPLACAEGVSAIGFKGKDLQVFLFEQNIIFSEPVGKKTQFSNPVYIYKAHIQVRKGLRRSRGIRLLKKAESSWYGKAILTLWVFCVGE